METAEEKAARKALKKSKKEKKEKKDVKAASEAEDEESENIVEVHDDQNKKKRKQPKNEEDTQSNKQIKNETVEVEEDVMVKKSAKSHAAAHELWKNGEQAWREGLLDQDYLSKNPDKITRLFCGNLNKKVQEQELKDCINGITHIKWITDKTTREFYGSTFLEMSDAKAAAVAVSQDGSKFMGRPLKIYYCPPRPGDTWPPVDDGSGKMPGAGGPNKVGAGGRREKAAKPPGCKKLFAGNCSYNIDDDTLVAFFKEAGAGEIVGLRWLTHKDSGDFRGCGFVEFASTEDADIAIKQDGKELLGRPIRLDWTD